MFEEENDVEAVDYELNFFFEFKYSSIYSFFFY